MRIFQLQNHQKIYLSWYTLLQTKHSLHCNTVHSQSKWQHCDYHSLQNVWLCLNGIYFNPGFFPSLIIHRDILTSTLHLTWTVTVSRSRHKVCCPAIDNSAAFGGLQPTAAPAHCPCLRLPPCPVQAGVIPLTRPLNRGIFSLFWLWKYLVKICKNMQMGRNT